MTQLSKPERAHRQSLYKIWGYSLYSPAENLFNGSDIDIYSGAYAGTSVVQNVPYTQWSNEGDYLDIEFYTDTAIYDYGTHTSDSTGYDYGLNVYENTNGVKGSIVGNIIANSRYQTWQQVTVLGRGRYRIERLPNSTPTPQRTSTEWYLENLETNFSLVKTENKIISIIDEVWKDAPISEPLSETDFITYGITDTSVISKDRWDELGNFEVLTWTPYDSVPNLQVDGSPYMQLDELERPLSLLYYRDNVDNTTPIPRLRQEYNLNVGVRQMIKKPIS